MPEPGSIIPTSEPETLELPALATARRGPAATVKFKPGVPELEFQKHFPSPYKVQAVTIYEAGRKGWVTDRSYWEFLEPFQYVSPKWGLIDIPKGFFTDFASVPPKLHSIIDDDSPIILFPSAPHDFLFTKRKSDGTRGWLPNGKQLSLTEVNRILTEAMTICGADRLTRGLVFAAVEVANQKIRNEFRS
jgi:hypothetical protein